ncbi:hypothetical protein DD238_003450 [Peronospora effusa]|uniref:DNA polymerase delta subunit 3 n=1 Tax=Peronospora effusa TaxID=542832 RepID=A0A3M6VF09_9STRA|nr:hypothetical protein DD238_003450 [Peronospora effusa]
MERCLEEISSTVLDAGEPISYRTLSIRSQVPSKVSIEALTYFSAENSNVKTLHLLIKRVPVATDDKSETAAAKRDPRARVLSLAVGSQSKNDDVLYQQIYALYSKPNTAAEDEDEVTAVATVCWAQERQARNDVFNTVTKNAPLSAAVKALYISGIKCVEATARQDVGEDQGEETISAFDAINTSIKKKLSSSSSSSSFFQSSKKTGGSKISSSSKNGDSKMTESRKQETKKLDMSNVLTVDSDDEEDDDETDAPMFVKTSSNNRIISDDDDDEEMDEVPPPKETGTPAPKTRNVKRKLNASPAETKKTKEAAELDDESPSNKKQRVESEDEADDDSVEEPVLETKRQVVVTKTRINEQGYMVTEKTYEEVELTAEEIEEEQKAAKKRVEEKKKKAAAEKATKAKKEAKKQSGPPKQRDLRSFFSTK